MRIFPKNFNFFKLFEAQADGVAAAIANLRELKKDGKLKKHAADLEAIEKATDVHTREVLKRLNETFITPIEREDIAELAITLDDIVDALEKATNRMVLMKIDPIPDAVYEYLDLIEKAVAEVVKGVKALKSQKKWGEVISHCHTVNAIESQADTVHRKNLGKLFEEETDALRIFKLSALYEILDDAADSCQTVAVVLERILIKNL
jgi:uncharacterized protein Yka (UPF0111/DUF47 family)